MYTNLVARFALQGMHVMRPRPRFLTNAVGKSLLNFELNIMNGMLAVNLDFFFSWPFLHWTMFMQVEQ